MKYSEYLKRVKAHLATPDEAAASDGGISRHPICYVNGDVACKLHCAAWRAQDKAAEQQAQKHYDRLDSAVASLMRAINAQLEARLGECTPQSMYPAALRALALTMDRAAQVDYTRAWEQQVRHELLDKWIAEAEQLESSDA